MMKRMIVGTLLVVMSIAGGSVVFAGRGPAGDCGKGCGQEMHGGRFYERMAKVLKLTSAQQERIKSLLSAEKTASKPLWEQMKEKRAQMMKFGESTTFDEAAVRSTAAAMGEIKTELTVIRVKTRTEINGVLTAEQREQMKNLRASKSHKRRNCGPECME